MAIEAYNYANVELDRIDADLASNARHLVTAPRASRSSQDRIARRLRDLYVSGEGDSTLEVISARRASTTSSRGSTRSSECPARTPDLAAVKRSASRGRARRKSLQDARADRRGSSRSGRRRRRRSRADRGARAAVRLGQGRDRSDCRRRSAAPGRARREARAARQPSSPRRRQPRRRSRYRDDDLGPPGSSRPRRHPTGRGPHRSSGSRCSTSACRTSGAAGPVRVRLLRAPHVRLRAGRGLAAAPCGVAVRQRRAGLVRRLAPGDLVFFSGLGHMGIYVGGGQFIHAPHTGDVVKISYLSDASVDYVGARRYPLTAPPS